MDDVTQPDDILRRMAGHQRKTVALLRPLRSWAEYQLRGWKPLGNYARSKAAAGGHAPSELTARRLSNVAACCRRSARPLRRSHTQSQ